MGWTSILTQLWLGVHGTVPGFWPIPMSKYSLRMFDTSPFIIPAKLVEPVEPDYWKNKSQASAVAGICQPNSRLRAHTCYIPIWTIFAYTLVSSINTENHRTPMISLVLWLFFCVQNPHLWSPLLKKSRDGFRVPLSVVRWASSATSSWRPSKRSPAADAPSGSPIAPARRRQTGAGRAMALVPFIVVNSG